MSHKIQLVLLAFFCAFIGKAQTGNQITSNGSTNENRILTPAEKPTPRITGARIFGVRPNHPFLFKVTATGVRPMIFSADNLPDGLSLDVSTGQITGVLKCKGENIVTLHAKNAAGLASRKLRIVAGDQIALTPPLGWNSWNCFSTAVSDADVRSAAAAMVSSGLINHGWNYINIDDCWQGNRNSQGVIQGNQNFPDMKALSDYVHGLGLKFGIYSVPGPVTCAGFEGSYQHEDQDVKRYAEWNVDYVKYDYCSYGMVSRIPSAEAILSELPKDSPDAKLVRRLSAEAVGKEYKKDYGELNEIDKQFARIYMKFGEEKKRKIDQLIYQDPFRRFRESLDSVDRDMVYSISIQTAARIWEWGMQVGCNCWRTNSDIREEWNSLVENGFGEAGFEKYASPGSWNDPDMLEIGHVPSKLTPDEQYTHMSLWSLLAAPLLIGCDMTRMDHFTIGLLSNDEVIDIDQDPLGKQASRISKNGDIEVWMRELEDGSRAVGLFNLGTSENKITVLWKSLGIVDHQMVRDVWRQKNIGMFKDHYETMVPSHGVRLIRIGL